MIAPKTATTAKPGRISRERESRSAKDSERFYTVLPIATGGRLRSTGRRICAALLGLALVALVVAAPVSAGPASDLSAAESRAATAEARVAAAREQLDAARADYAEAARRADPLAATADDAGAKARNLRSELVDEQQEARAEIARLEASWQQEEDDQAEEEAGGIGFGLAALIAGTIGLIWGRFRRSALVVALGEFGLAQAVGLCVGGGLLLLLIGGLMLGGGIAGVIGGLFAGLGIALPVAFLLARHSLEVERGRAKPVGGRERLPDWVSRTAAVLLLLLALAGILGAIGGDDPSAPAVTGELREKAANPEEGPGAERLAEAETEAAKARQVAARPIARRETAERIVRSASRQLGRARGQVVKARAEVRRFTRQLAVLVAREEREAEKQAEREAEEAAEVEEEELEFFEEEEGGGGCDPNYSPCVPTYPPDVDCAEVGGSVSVIGSDPHGLDADGDGIGCE